MVLKIVKTRPMDVISPVMIMTAATAVAVVVIHTVVMVPVMAMKLQIAVLKIVVVVAAVKTAMTAPMILLRTALNAVIPPGMNLALIVPH